MNKARRPIVAVDFDGTIVEHRYPEMGRVLPGAVATLQWVSTWADIIIWTCRHTEKNLEEMRLTLAFHEIPYDRINDNMGTVGFEPRPKIYYDICIDDRNLEMAVRGVDWGKIHRMLKEFQFRWFYRQ